MRLKNIKLAGFKSFVEPTTVAFPSDLVAIVGPNGCGKSNVIDAVRWVMGESSAKQLRGEAMTDVIFNGSANRQPLAQASVELNFDNSEGKLGGEYAKYAEISVRREVTLDGQSNYYLNGVRCRRRDITGLFLGTGLGPRSYAIIKQDMIARIIEAKPEELRVYLEEAAGISKYKERRKETETRMRHTRENLERLQDLRGEVAKQLEHLQRQAQAAERYKEYKGQEVLLKAQALALHWRGLDQGMQAQRQTISEAEAKQEGLVAEQRNIEAAREHHHQEQLSVSADFNAIQSEYYQIGADIARLEQNVQHNRERKQQLQADQLEVEEQWQAAQTHVTTDEQQLQLLQTQLTSLEPQLNEVQQQATQAEQVLRAAEADVAAWQEQWDSVNTQTAQASQQAEVNKTKLAHLEEQCTQAKKRVQQLTEEQAQCLFDDAPLQSLKQQEANQEQQLQQEQNTFDGIQSQLVSQRDANNQSQQALDKARSELQTLQGKHASLQVLQQAALGGDDDSVVNWLTQQGLADKPRLAQQLDVEAGWQHAVETVLGDYLQAVCVDDNDVHGIEAMLSSLNTGTLSFVHGDSQAPGGDDTLLSKIKPCPGVAGLLANIYVADTLTQALQKATQLNAHESIITPEGIWLGKNWLRVARDKDQGHGVLQREQELANLQQRMLEQQQHVEDLQDQYQQGQAAQLKLEQQRDAQQTTINQVMQQLAKTRSDVQVQQAKLKQIEQRAQKLGEELNEQQAILAKGEQDYAQVRSAWEAALNHMQTQTSARDELQTQGQSLRDALVKAQTQHQHALDQRYQQAMQFESLSQQRDALLSNSSRMQDQISQLSKRREQLQKVIGDSEEPLQELEQDLQSKLQNRVRVAEKMNAVRQQLGGIEEQMQKLEQQRQSLEHELQDQREALQQQRLDIQSSVIRQKTIEEQLIEQDQTLTTLLEEMPEDAQPELWDEKIEALQRRIQRLGAINLAAIDECESLTERRDYLDTQNEDLQEALQTLENAIHKIDQETKQRFKDTLERVNADYSQLFPRVFGGGSAELELTGNDLLDAGVVVKARPPGKRNSSVHLLSGGEKALTALALVFAIFQLNPAPFCMLDEVDAPLDDANVMRFSQLVQDMSSKVQFIFITHNKVTMEMAQQLMGVTMHEPGVSRLVSVDVEDAMALAEA